MNKNEFLAFSLPYDLVGITQNRLVKINGINYENQLPIIWDSINKEKSDFSGICGFGIMLILHPLSDLTKEIEHKEEKFVPIIELIKIKYSILLDLQDEDFSIYTDGYPRACYTTNAIWEIMINPYYLSNEEFWIIQKLIEWHFDISYFIPRGEAIDVNTLEINPYK